MQFLADVLLGAGALGAGFYCHVLSQRLKAFSTLETGLGGAIAVLSAQVDDMTQVLEAARGSATGSAASLEDLVARAAAMSTRLELLLASLHDLPAAPDAALKERVSASLVQGSAGSLTVPAPARVRFVRHRGERRPEDLQ